MKKLFLLMGIAAMGIVQYATAQQLSPALQAAPGGQMTNGQQMTPEVRAKRQSDMMAKDLGLSADVQTKVYNVNLKYAKMREDMMKSGKSREEMQPQMKQMMTDRDNDLKGVLSADQYAKYKENAGKMRQGMMQQGGQKINNGQ